jgi:hypothetical protein
VKHGREGELSPGPIDLTPIDLFEHGEPLFKKMKDAGEMTYETG